MATFVLIHGGWDGGWAWRAIATTLRTGGTYVLYTAKAAQDPLVPIMARMAERARAAGWQYRELATGHFPELDQPQEVAHLLLDFA